MEIGSIDIMGTLTGTENRIYASVKVLLRLVLKFSVKIEVCGLENIPATGGAVLVSNHRSDVDPSILAVAIPRYISWVIADYMQAIPTTYTLIKWTGMVLMNVEGSVSLQSVKQALRVLQQGHLLGIFPEGDHYIFANDFSAPLAPFYPGFARLAIKQQVPVIPIVICPIQERLQPIRIPPELRTAIAQRYDLSQIRQIVRYKSVRVVIGQPLDPIDCHQNDRQSIDRFIQHTRSTLQHLQRSGLS